MSREQQVADNIFALRARISPPYIPLADMRFRALLGAERWAQLPAAVQKRFSKRLTGPASITYTGEVVDCQISRVGAALAYVLKVIGAPLPLARDTLVPAIVTVTEDQASGGQFWTRHYGHHRGFPQVIQSTKQFSGPTGLEEYVGGGVGVALTIDVRAGALMFLSDHYFLRVGKWRLRLPRWLAPGQLTVGHIDCGDGWFAFTLTLTHAVLGTLIAQTALFTDAG